MIVHISQLKDVEIEESRDGKEIIIKLTEENGSYYGGKTEIKMPAKSYEMLEGAIVERWLDNVKDSI